MIISIALVKYQYLEAVVSGWKPTRSLSVPVNPSDEVKEPGGPGHCIVSSTSSLLKLKLEFIVNKSS
jgi:hypothetical protein